MSFNPQDVKKLFKLRDKSIRVMSKDGKFRAVAINNTKSVAEAQEKHKLHSIPAMLLARSLSTASMMSAFLKGEERVVVEFEGNGLIKKLYAEALSVGEVRGFIHSDTDFSTAIINDIEEIFGIGLMKVSRVLYDSSEPSESYVPIHKGDIATDTAYYLTQSEQIPSAVVLDATVDDTGIINYSGGLIVQAMPGATEQEVKEVVDAITNAPHIIELMEQGMNVEEILKITLPFEFEVIKSTQVDFFCRCSKEKFLSRLNTFPITEINDMIAEGQNELVCMYCNSKYIIEHTDFDNLKQEITAKMN